MTYIVKTKELDLPLLAEMRAESVREGCRFIERLCADWTSGANRFDAPGEALFLAMAGAQVVGVCGLNRDPHAADSQIGWVRRLYVVPASRRTGVGRALLATVIDHARRYFTTLRVRTEAADHFYTANGFQRLNAGGDASHCLEFTPAAP